MRHVATQRMQATHPVLVQKVQAKPLATTRPVSVGTVERWRSLVCHCVCHLGMRDGAGLRSKDGKYSAGWQMMLALEIQPAMVSSCSIGPIHVATRDAMETNANAGQGICPAVAIARILVAVAAAADHPADHPDLSIPTLAVVHQRNAAGSCPVVTAAETHQATVDGSWMTFAVALAHQMTSAETRFVATADAISHTVVMVVLTAAVARPVRIAVAGVAFVP